MIKQLFYDLETTGTEFWKHGIHQIAGIICIDGIEKQSFDFKVKPNEKALISDEALEIGKVTKEQIMEYPSMVTIHKKLIDILDQYVDRYSKTDKYHLVGYNNSSFDNQFLRAWFKQCGDNYFGSWFWSDTQDVMVLASDKLKDIRHTMENFKLRTVAKTLGIEVDVEKTHDALYDIKLTMEAYKCLR